MLEAMNLLLLTLAIQAIQGEPARAPISDACGSDASFVEYRDRLNKAVETKDAAALKPLVASDILVDFGGGSGWPSLVQDWGLDQANASALWAELAEVLALGCGDLNGVKFIPGNFASLGEFDEPYPPYFAVGKGAAFRSKPNDTAPLVMQLDNHILFELDDSAPEGWLHARLTDGRPGYVRLASVRSAIDYRASFELRDGQWVMTSFLAGD